MVTALSMRVSITRLQEALGVASGGGDGGKSEALAAASTPMPAVEHVASSGAAASAPSQAPGEPSWLMPHQRSDRDEGRRQARAVASRRTPSGAFANFDLPVSP